ncbi:MAG TPA: COX15/CtaA family protein [Rhizomicrobium sp.]|jgi:cytochrome c oxidase assembly protein subunit 15|nr:COX15/CtaA family protein [Rhizomicrobium sp.]
MTDVRSQQGFSLQAPGPMAVAIWLFFVAAMIVAMVVVGGLTRLTGSGLSITEWDPIVGAIPPLSDAAWQDAFHKYQQIPQYLHENSGMTLDGFKGIFWWEWAHRLLGRAIGFVFFVPFVWFAYTGAITRAEWPRMIVLFVLGGLQGVVGWWMVASGLEFRDSVSQYRLAAHLGVALLLLGAIFWTGLEYWRGKTPVVAKSRYITWSYVLIALIFFQMLLGAFVAGLHAGLIYNNWPMMGWRWTPEGAFFNTPWWINFFENAGLVQFNHRIVAYLVMAVALPLGWRLRKEKPGKTVVDAAGFVFVLTCTQVLLGIMTLRTHVLIWLAAMHQINAALLLCAAIWLTYELRRLSAGVVVKHN